MSNKLLKINDPIHGFIIFFADLRKIVDSKEVQRLIRIKQLSGASHVFPGANHTRFEHSLGVAALAQRLMNNLKKIHKVDLSKNDINDGIVAALLHDVGHGPFSHNFETILLEHDKDHEDFTEWIINKSELGDILEDLSFDKKYISKIATGRLLGSQNKKGSLISQLITSAVNVDSMDYLLRDNYHCGTEGRSVDINRLLLSIDEMENGFLGVNIRSLIALEGFLLSRISSFRTIYFHKTCRAVQIMLAEAMKTAADDIGLLNYTTPNDYTKWDDYILWSKLIEHPKSKKIITKIQKRDLLKSCYESQIKMTEKEINPEDLKLKLSELSGIPSSEIFVDLPSSSNVPYGHTNEMRPNVIYTFKENKENNVKELVNLEDYSLFFNQFTGHLKIIRIYSWAKNRKKLSKICKKLLDS